MKLQKRWKVAQFVDSQDDDLFKKRIAHGIGVSRKGNKIYGHGIQGQEDVQPFVANALFQRNMAHNYL